MDVALLPVIPIPARSSSLPIAIPANPVCESPCRPSPHGDAVMLLTDSSTPPSSPCKALLAPELSMQSQAPYTTIQSSDHSPDPSPPHSPPQSITESAPDHDMDHDCAPPLANVRLLDDEEEHVHRSLRLQDFEVRGTLGTQMMPLVAIVLLTQSGVRYLLQALVPLAACYSSNTDRRSLIKPILSNFLQ